MFKPHFQESENLEVKPLKQFKQHEGAVERIAFDSQKKNLVYSCSHDHTIKQWDIPTGKEQNVFTNHQLGVWCIDTNSVNRLLASTSPDRTVQLFDPASNKVVMNNRGSFEKGYWVEFSPNADMLAAGGQSGNVELYDLKKGSIMKNFAMKDSIVYNARFMNNGHLVCSTSKGNVLVFDSGLNLVFEENLTDKELRTIEVDQGMLYTAFADNKLRQYKIDLENKKLTPETEFDAHMDVISTIHVDRENGILFTGCKDSSLYAWNLAEKKFMHNLVGHIDQIRDVQVQPGQKTVMSCSWDQTLRSYSIDEILK